MDHQDKSPTLKVKHPHSQKKSIKHSLTHLDNKYNKNNNISQNYKIYNLLTLKNLNKKY